MRDPELLLEIQHDALISASEAIDRLPVVADREQSAVGILLEHGLH